jgi:ankyrin repeat protein
MFNFKFPIKYVVLIVFFGLSKTAFASSYDDFFKAIHLDNVRVVQSLLQRGFDPNTVNPDGVPGLMLAVRDPSLKVAELLASHPETQTEVRNDKDESVLMLAALKGYLPLVQKLVANDADVNKTGWTPLHYAATGGHVPVIAYLLDEHAYIDAESPNGTTPLMMAARYGSPEAVKHLIQAGADIRLKNQLGLTALDFAVAGNRLNAQELIRTALQRLPRQSSNSPRLDNAQLVQDVPVLPMVTPPAAVAPMVNVPSVPLLNPRTPQNLPVLPMPAPRPDQPAYTNPIR